jgi:hypothetical protein
MLYEILQYSICKETHKQAFEINHYGLEIWRIILSKAYFEQNIGLQN